MLCLAGVFVAASLARAEVIKVASGSMLSGPQANLGEMIKLGSQLAVEEARAHFEELGFDLQFSPQDDQAQPDVGVAVARRIINDKDVLAIAGHFNSGVTIPTSEVYKEDNLAMISSGSTNPRVTDRGLSNVSRVCGRDDVQGPVGAEFAVNDLKAKRIFVIHDKTAYGQGIAEAFREKAKELGANVVAFAGTEEKTNLQPLILQMRALKPDLVYFGGMYDQGAVLLKQMRERGIKATFLGPDGLESSSFVEIAQQAAVGAYYTTVAGPAEKYPAAKEFIEDFTRRFGRAPEAFSLYGYDAAKTALLAIENAIAENGGKKPTRKQVSEAARKVKFDGVTGPISFNKNGDRAQADYWIIHYTEAKYPGTPVKSISATPPAQ